MNWRTAAEQHAAECYPAESCGLVVRAADGAELYWPCRNVATDGEFQAHWDDLARAEDLGFDVVGVVHSHPDQPVPRPSPADIACCDCGLVPWHVVGWPSGRWVTFDPRHTIPDLIGREFNHGRLDCYSIVRDWFRIERSVVLPDYPRTDEWWTQGGNLYADQFADAGFVEVPGPPQPGDVLLMQILSPVINHAAVYLGDDMVLHHLAKRLSAREPWDGALRALTRKILRHDPAA